MLTLNIRGATVTIPEAEIKRLWLAGVREEPTTSIKFPRIGSPWNGGVYAGIVRGDAGERDYQLVVSTLGVENKTWEAAKAWAPNLTPYAGYSWGLPTRRDQAVLYGNVPELFAKQRYWSGEEYAPDAAYAWAQSFSYGSQDYAHHRYEFRARAVLHIPVGEGE